MTDILRQKTKNILQSLEQQGITQSYCEKLTGVDFQRLVYFAHGQIAPKKESLVKFRDTLGIIEKYLNGKLNPTDIFTKYYTEKMTTKCLADQLEIDESILVRIMQMNEGIRAKVLGRLEKEAL